MPDTEPEVASKIRKADTAPAPTVSLSFWAALFGVALSILLVEIFTDPDRYADIDSYVLYLDQLVHFPSKTLLVFEPLSNLYLLALHWLFRSVETSIDAAHYLLGLTFVIFLVRLFPRQDTAWQSVLFVFAVLGPLLAFVTLRATPAYFLVAVSVHYANEKKIRAFGFFILATLFHISAMLAFVPLLALYFRDRLPKALRTQNPKVMLGAIVLIGFPIALLPQISNTLSASLQSIPILSKFTAYTDQGNLASVNSLNHYIFLAVVLFLCLAYIALALPEDRTMYIYVVMSLLIYLMLFFATSPVAAFRQAPFWLIPMIAVFPWRRIGVTEATAPIYVVICGGLFYVQLMQVYI